LSLSCQEARALFEPYAAETLSRQERGDVREHLHSCASCLQEGGASDPGLLFAGVPDEEVSPAEVARVVTAVRAGIDFKIAEGRLSAGSSRRRAGAVASAAAIVALTLALPGSLGRQATPPETRQARAAAPGGAFVPVAYPPGEARVLPARGPEPKTPADATIYNWNPGGKEPRVVWIVDRSLDI